MDWPTVKYIPSEKKGENLLTNWMDTVFTLFTPKEVTTLKNNIESSTIMTFIAVLQDIAAGQLDQKQYLNYYKYINKVPTNIEEEYNIRENLSETEEFSLTYEGHYRVRKINLLEDVLMSENKGSADWYLKELKKKDVDQIEEGLIRKQLNEIKDQYTILQKNKSIICSKSLEIDRLREWILRLTHVNLTIKTLLEDPTAYVTKAVSSINLANYLPQDKIKNFVEQNKIFKKLDEIFSTDQ